MITTKPFGTTKEGYQITEYILKNKNGMEVHLLNYGAVIKNIFVPDKNGQMGDVVLGFDDLNEEVLRQHINPNILGYFEPTDEWNREFSNDRIWS